MILKKVKNFISFYLIYQMNQVRFLRSLGTKIGQNCDIYTNFRNFGSEPWLIEIEDNVTITQNVMFVTHDGSSRIFRNEFPEMSQFGNRFGPIIIKKNSFIGVNSIILPGVVIGPDSIVGAGSIVIRDVPPETVVAGNPARFLYSLDDYIQHYRENMVPVLAKDRVMLRKELTQRFWGSER